MLYWLAQFTDRLSVLNVFRYLTVRTGGATFTAFVFVFLFGPAIINLLRLKQGKGQPIREDGPESHLLSKRGTPTMGGLMILTGITVATVLWANPRNPYVWIVLGAVVGWQRFPQDLHQRTGAEHQIDVAVEDRLHQVAMQRRPVGPELEHVAKHRDPTALRADRRLAEQTERGPHRCRVGVVALVDQ